METLTTKALTAEALATDTSAAKALIIAGKELPLPLKASKNDGPLAINETTITKELFKEAFTITFSRASQKVIVVLGEAIAVIGLACLVFASFLDSFTNDFFSSNPMLSLSLIVMGICILFYGFMIPGQARKNKFKVMSSKARGGPITRRISFYESYLEVEGESGQKQRFDYESIQKCEETSHLYVLISDKKAIMIDKDGFHC